VITNTVVNTIQMISSAPTIEEQTIPMKLFPNPMSTHSTLSYTLEESENITISLYDLLGNNIRVLQPRTNQPAGKQFLKLENLDIPSGVYYLRLQTNTGKISTLKLIKNSE